MTVSNDLLFGIGSQVFQRASSDAEFRALALRDGTAAVEQVVGAPLPDGLKIRFVENDGAAITLGLPPARTTDELSDRELEAVAGGRNFTGPSVPGPSVPGPTLPGHVIAGFDFLKQQSGGGSPPSGPLLPGGPLLQRGRP
jgi:hypothetical protein